MPVTEAHSQDVERPDQVCDQAQQGPTVTSGAGGNSMFAARANKKTAGIVAAYPKRIESGKELKSIAGIGKGSQDKVSTTSLLATAHTQIVYQCLFEVQAQAMSSVTDIAAVTMKRLMSNVYVVKSALAILKLCVLCHSSASQNCEAIWTS